MKLQKIMGIGAALSAGLVVAGITNASTVVSVAFNGNAAIVTGSSGSYGISSSSYADFSWTSFSIDVTQTATESLLSLTIGNLTSSGSSQTLPVTVSASGFTFLPTAVGSGQQTSASANGENTVTGDQVGVTGSSTNGSTTSYVTQAFTLNEPGGTTSSASYNTALASASSIQSPYSLSLFSDVTIKTPTTDKLISYSADVAVTSAPVTNATPLPGSGALALVGGLALIGGMAIRRRVVR